MLDRLKGILSIWLLKYWYLLLLSISLSVATFYYFEHEGKSKVYDVKMMGSTLLLSQQALQGYLDPLILACINQDYKSANQLLHISEDLLTFFDKKKKSMFSIGRTDCYFAPGR